VWKCAMRALHAFDPGMGACRPLENFFSCQRTSAARGSDRAPRSMLILQRACDYSRSEAGFAHPFLATSLARGGTWQPSRHVAFDEPLCNNCRMAQGSGIYVRSFDHVTIICADLEATRRFYVDLLGMAEVQRPAFKFPGLWFQLGNVQIHATGESPESGTAGWGNQAGTVTSRGHHIAFQVDDVRAASEIAQANGVRIASPLQQRPDGYKQVYLYDPDGHLVELVSE
jgi:catechol 2,3-dioxygenase-like lactoylglutathione lyase family enzyme